MPIYDLKLRGALHQGEFLGIHRESILDHVPSDSLFAALVTAWARLGAEMETYLQGFSPGERAPFRLTSAFPRAGKVRFYPVPPRLPEIEGLEYKQAKKIRWLSAGVLEKLITGKTPSIEPENFLHGKSTWFTSSEFSEIKELLQFGIDGTPALWGEQISPRVVVGRLDNVSNLFFAGRMVFAPQCGLWFGARGETSRIDEALSILQDDGLGGLRASGHGAFDWKKSNEELAEAPKGWGYSLARFAPQKEEIGVIKNEKSAYRLETVHGWCKDDTGKAWRRRAVRMLAEGALLPAEGLQGDIVNVRPAGVGDWLSKERAVYRAGYAFLIPAGKLVEAA